MGLDMQTLVTAASRRAKGCSSEGLAAVSREAILAVRTISSGVSSEENGGGCIVSHPEGSTSASPSASSSSAERGHAAVTPRSSDERKRKLPLMDPLTPPPPASEFPAYQPRDFFRFELVHQSTKSAARVGRIHTPHGVIDTPGYVAVGTNGALKSVSHRELAAAGIDLMFANTYHLTLQPGPELVAAAGGLHTFIGRDGPIITDSGGFQVFPTSRSLSPIL